MAVFGGEKLPQLFNNRRDANAEVVDFFETEHDGWGGCMVYLERGVGDIERLTARDGHHSFVIPIRR
jgi:hypothetical protein